uniref:Uncharacterized protein n=1 Tax=Tetradesmus obliquus TaxID=3088 RepID=A0A383W637_TETOB|eukprot:jgi/Sobl393_1/15687/SZX73098.1
MAPHSAVKPVAQQASQLVAAPASEAVLAAATPASASAMQAAVTAMNSIGSSEDSPSSLEACDYIFTTMQQQARSAAPLPDMLPASTTDIGRNAANIAILSAAQPKDVTPEMTNTVFNGLNSSSGYIRNKAKQALQDVLQQPTLSRACADTAAAGMRSIITYFAKNNSPSATTPTPQAPVVVPPAIPTPASPAANNSSSSQGTQQLPSLAAWALDMLLTVAHVDEMHSWVA